MLPGARCPHTRVSHTGALSLSARRAGRPVWDTRATCCGNGSPTEGELSSGARAGVAQMLGELRDRNDPVDGAGPANRGTPLAAHGRNTCCVGGDLDDLAAFTSFQADGRTPADHTSASAYCMTVWGTTVLAAVLALAAGRSGRPGRRLWGCRTTAVGGGCRAGGRPVGLNRLGSRPRSPHPPPMPRAACRRAEHRRCLRRRHRRTTTSTAEPRPGVVVRDHHRPQPGHQVPAHAATLRKGGGRRESRRPLRTRRAPRSSPRTPSRSRPAAV